MTEDIKRKLILELKINNYLSDVESYAESAYQYLIGNPLITDKEEVLTGLSCISECVEIIDKLIEELELIYENE